METCARQDCQRDCPDFHGFPFKCGQMQLCWFRKNLRGLPASWTVAQSSPSLHRPDIISLPANPVKKSKFFSINCNRSVTADSHQHLAPVLRRQGEGGFSQMS